MSEMWSRSHMDTFGYTHYIAFQLSVDFPAFCEQVYPPAGAAWNWGMFLSNSEYLWQIRKRVKWSSSIADTGANAIPSGRSSTFNTSPVVGKRAELWRRQFLTLNQIRIQVPWNFCAYTCTTIFQCGMRFVGGHPNIRWFVQSVIRLRDETFRDCRVKSVPSPLKRLISELLGCWPSLTAFEDGSLMKQDYRQDEECQSMFQNRSDFHQMWLIGISHGSMPL